MSINHNVGNEMLEATRIVARWNRPMGELYVNLQTYLPDAVAVESGVANASSAGTGVFETLTKLAPRLADAIHDFIYQIAVPHNSITTKDIARERVTRALFNLV